MLVITRKDLVIPSAIMTPNDAAAPGDERNIVFESCTTILFRILVSLVIANKEELVRRI